MFIKTENGWRAWQSGVVNFDGAALKVADEPKVAFVQRAPEKAFDYSKHIHLKLNTAAEDTEAVRRFMEKLVKKVSSGSTHRNADGRLTVKMLYSSWTV